MRKTRMAAVMIALCVVLLGAYMIEEISVAQDGVAVEVTDCPNGVCPTQPAVTGAVYQSTGVGCGTSAATRYATQGRTRRAGIFRRQRGPIRAWVARAFGARSSCGG
jgi:hypothetical protein